MAQDKEAGYTLTVHELERDPDTAEEVSRILIEMGALWVRLTKEFEKTGFEHAVREYIECLKVYAEAVVDGRDEEECVIEQGAFVGERELFGAYIGDSPDSAIGLGDEQPLGRILKEAMARNPEYAYYQIDDIIEEGEEEEGEDSAEGLTAVPSRAPTPPPKDVKRLELIRRGMMSPSGIPPELPTDSGPVAEIHDEEQGLSQSHSNSNSTKSSQSQGPETPPTPKSSRLSKILVHVRKNSVDRPITVVGTPPQTGTTTTTTTTRGSTDMRPSTPVMQGSLVRRGSRRLSVTFKRLPMWNEVDQLLGAEPEKTVFGVSLQKSIEVAKGTAKTHHSGGGRASRRTYPLCVQKCCLQIKAEGLETPGIFAERGDAGRVRRLKETFSTPPAYGADVDWDRYGVHDAADLILLYLTQLPRPLVSESTARRWVALSRQATVTGSHGTRSEQCIDFWEEALGTVRGAAARSLFKLLLNLWADVAAAADQNDMTAERLAACVLKPLMHVTSDKRETDFVLALAFLIRKRTEYVDMLREDQVPENNRASKAAW